MSYKDDFQFLRTERTKLVNEIADRQTENLRLREAIAAAMSALVIDEFDLAYDILERAIRSPDVCRAKAV